MWRVDSEVGGSAKDHRKNLTSDHAPVVEPSRVPTKVGRHHIFRLMLVHSNVWKDLWLADYATALIQENWGRSLTKFTGTLPGGIQLNGQYILEEARSDLA